MIKNAYTAHVENGITPLILDIGANIGCASLWFKEHYPSSKIVAVEPDSRNFEVLKCNSVDGIEPRNLALASHDNGVALVRFENDAAHRTCNHGDIRVPSASLSSLVKRYSTFTPFIIKIDIEGAEKDVFSINCPELYHFPLVIFEPHDWMIPKERTSAGIMRQMCSANYEILLGRENLFFIRID